MRDRDRLEHRASTDEAFVLDLVEHDEWMMRCLRAVHAVDPPDWWIVGGFLRCRVWDHLHEHAERTLPGDIDVVFFDRDRPPEHDQVVETRLRALEPSYPWEVYNQAYMHEYNHDAPYRDAVDSFSRWAETVSTIGLKLDGDGVLRLVAPHGLGDLVDMVIRPTPHPDAQRDVFDERLETKGWRQRWPKVRVATDPDG